VANAAHLNDEDRASDNSVGDVIDEDDDVINGEQKVAHRSRGGHVRRCVIMIGLKKGENESGLAKVFSVIEV